MGETENHAANGSQELPRPPDAWIRRGDVFQVGVSLASIVAVLTFVLTRWDHFGDELRQNVESFENRIAKVIESQNHRIERIEDRLDRRR